MQGPGSLNNVVANTVQIVGADGGIFEYSGNTPATGTLIGSDTGQDGTDLYGNHYVIGKVSYSDATGIASRVANGVVQVLTGSLSTGWTVAGTLHYFGGQIILDTNNLPLVLNSGTAGTTISSPLTATGGTAASPTVVDTDGWHNVSPLPTINGGTATGRLRYKMTNDKCVMIDCALGFTAFAAQSGVIQLVTLAAPYSFAIGGQFPIRVFTATAPANAEWVGTVTSGGIVEVNNLPVGTNSIAFIHTQPMD